MSQQNQVASAPQPLTTQQIVELAKAEKTPAAQKRKINALFRAQDSKKGLPAFNNAFSVADRAIKRASRFLNEVGSEFSCYYYATQIEGEIRMVVKDAWNRV